MEQVVHVGQKMSKPTMNLKRSEGVTNFKQPATNCLNSTQYILLQGKKTIGMLTVLFLSDG